MDKRAENIMFNLKNQDVIIKMKRAKKSFHQSLLLDYESKDPITIKSDKEEDTDEAITRKIIPSVYNYIDKTGEVMADNVFKKSIKENQKNILHIKDHILDDISYRVGNTKTLEETEMEWKYFNVKKEGSTQVLLAESEILRDYNSDMFMRYKSGIQQAHSVGFFVMKMMLAADNKEYKENYDLYNKMLPLLGNAEIGEQLGMFYVIQEGKLVEFSALEYDAPANNLTRTIDKPTKSFYDFLVV